MKNYEKILFDLTLSIEAIENKIHDTIDRAEKGIQISSDVLTTIHINNDGFKNNKQGMEFFRVIKPKIHSWLIYYTKLFNIESERPKSINRIQIQYLNNYIQSLYVYFNEHQDFYSYYEKRAFIFNEEYFIKGKADIRLFPDSFHFFTDDQFSTNHDITVAHIMAYERLIVYLKKEIDKLDHNSNALIPQNFQK
ncbi:RteC domain-containing protein [Aquimarina rhabdastrellae]